MENKVLEESQNIPLDHNRVYFKATCDFKEIKDIALFYYSLDGKKWHTIGDLMKMPYTLPHFMGYRFGLFNPYFAIDFLLQAEMPANTGTSSFFYPHHRDAYVCGKNSPGATQERCQSLLAFRLSLRNSIA